MVYAVQCPSEQGRIQATDIFVLNTTSAKHCIASSLILTTNHRVSDADEQQDLFRQSTCTFEQYLSKNGVVDLSNLYNNKNASPSEPEKMRDTAIYQCFAMGIFWKCAADQNCMASRVVDPHRSILPHQEDHPKPRNTGVSRSSDNVCST
ncbi:hypothetical protein MRB53_037466 [Persea americana]|nr:hypothetical protein MRB53_037466 [Persea americana]